MSFLNLKKVMSELAEMVSFELADSKDLLGYGLSITSKGKQRIQEIINRNAVVILQEYDADLRALVVKIAEKGFKKIPVPEEA